MQTLATRITFIRILFLPLFIGLLVSDLPHKQWFAGITFAVIAITDGLDGYVARNYNQVTDFGKILDPLADKIVIIAALITLVQVAGLPAWAASAIIIREIVISLFRASASKKNVVISASPLGKIKTVTQIVAIFCWIFNIGTQFVLINFLSWLSLILAVLFSFISGIDYLLKFKGIWTQE